MSPQDALLSDADAKRKLAEWKPSPLPEAAIPVKQPHGKSVGGFAENVLDDSWNTLKGIALGVLEAWPTAIKAGYEILSDPKGIARLWENPDHLWREMSRTGGAIVDAVTEPYRKHGLSVFYHRPATTMLDALTIWSLGAGSVGKFGKLVGNKAVQEAGQKLARLPSDLAGKGLDKAYQAVGINRQIRRETLTLWREEQGRAVNVINDDMKVAGDKVRTLSNPEADMWHRWRTLGVNAEEFAANPAVAEAFVAYRKLSKLWQDELIARGLLDRSQAAIAVAKKYADEMGWSLRTQAEARVSISRALREIRKLPDEYKPLYGPGIVERKGGWNLDDFLKEAALQPALRKEGFVGFLEAFKGGADYIKDPRIYVPRAIQAFRQVEAKLRYIDRVLQSPKLALRASMRGEGVEQIIPTKGVFAKYFDDNARAKAVYERNLVAKHGPEEAARLITQDAAIAQDFANVSSVVVDPTVKNILRWQFHSAGGPVARFLRVHDAILNVFRRSATVWSPRWYLGNIVGDAILSLLAGATFGNLRRARKFMDSMPSELRAVGRVGPMIGDASPAGRFMSKFDSFGDMVQGIDQATRAGIFDYEVARRLKEAGASFFAGAESFEQVYRATAMAPDELSRIQVAVQALGERISTQVPVIARGRAEIVALTEKLAKQDADLARFAAPESAQTAREAQIAAQLTAIGQREAAILSGRQTLSKVQAAAGKEVKGFAQIGVPGVAKKLEQSMRQEHAAANALYRQVIKDIRDQGGIRSTLQGEAIPKELRNKNGVASDILEQNLFDQGLIASPDIDALGEFLTVALEASKRPLIDRAAVRAQARKLVTERSAIDVDALVKTGAERAKLLRELTGLRATAKAKAQEAAEIAGKRQAVVGQLEEARELTAQAIAQKQSLLDDMVADVRADVIESGALYGQIQGLEEKAAIARAGVERANAFLGDYLGLGPIEQSLFRRMVPFYPWAKAMTSLAFRLPFLAPKSGFMWNRYAAAMQTLAGDPELPEWMAGYVPIAATGTGDMIWARLGSLSPFGGLGTRRVGTVPIPSIAAFWEQNPMVAVSFRIAGGRTEFQRQSVPYGDPVVSMADGTVLEVTDEGKLQRVIQQEPIVSAALHMFPSVQLAEQLLSGFEVAGHSTLGFPKGILKPDGSYKYPRELWERLVSAAAVPIKTRSREDIIRAERVKLHRTMLDWKKIYRRSGPEDREFIKRVFDDYSAGTLKMEYR